MNSFNAECLLKVTCKNLWAKIAISHFFPKIVSSELPEQKSFCNQTLSEYNYGYNCTVLEYQITVRWL